MKGLPTWIVTVRDKVTIRGRKEPEDWDRCFFPRARTAASARKAIIDAGYSNIISVEKKTPDMEGY